MKEVPENLMTQELCLEAVRQFGWALNYIPENLRTAEICLEAVRQDGFMLFYIPKNLKTAELCIDAFNNMIESSVPQHMRDEVRAAIKSGE